MRASAVWILALLCVASLSAVPAARAQQADDLQGAAAAFAEGQRAQLRGEYARAAELFEVADQSAPSPEARRSAIRNHRAAEQLARAATLAAHALVTYPDDAETRALAEETLAAAEPALGRVDVSCTPECAVALDGRAAWQVPVASLALYVEPGTHRIVASFAEGGDTEREIALEAGGSEALSLAPEAIDEAVDEAVDEAADQDVTTATPIEPPLEGPRPSGVHPAAFGVLAGITAVGIGLTIWSGLDTLAARDAYVAAPTQAGYEDGVLLEWRTNGLLFGTIAFGVASAVLALFTDFGSGSPLVVGVGPTPGGAYAAVSIEASP